MHETILHDPDGVRFHPDRPTGVGVLTLGGSSGRIDVDRARLLADHGAVSMSIRWFGGPGQHPGPWEIGIETFQAPIAALAAECDRIVLMGVSFGAEAALVTAAHTPVVDTVVAFAPSDVVWAGVRPDGSQTSHWTIDGDPLPYVEFVDDWRPATDPPAYRTLYQQSYAADPYAGAAAAIEVERIPELILVFGGDDQVWPADEMAERIAARRRDHGRPTMIISDPAAGHRTILPGEPEVAAGQRMARGGTPVADRRLGERAWPEILSRLGPADSLPPSPAPPPRRT